MNALQKIYVLRLALGFVAALLCIGYGIATNTITNDPAKFGYTMLLNGVTIAMATYLISYYLIKRLFLPQVEKPQKLITMGIGVYFISWIIFWIFMYTLIAGAPPPI